MNGTDNRVPAPLFRDPIYDGATDPTVIYSREDQCWYMFYTQRRSSQVNIGVSSVHGTQIGVATSGDGAHWLYRGALPNLEFERGHNTFWAPEIIWAKGKYHMYVSYVQGVPTTWNYGRRIVHYTADNLWEWTFESVLPLSSDRVIDACVYEIEDGLYKMWYKDERDNSYTHASVSRDLYTWQEVGREVMDVPHEGPNVFELGGKKWMITDFWDGLGVYETEDFSKWKRAGTILNIPGSRADDGGLGHHADIVPAGDVAYIFYFVHPSDEIDGTQSYQKARTSVQAGVLRVVDGALVCDRDQEFSMRLTIPEQQ